MGGSVWVPPCVKRRRADKHGWIITDMDRVYWVTVPAPESPTVNGYVFVHEHHPWHGSDYEDITVPAPIPKLTYSHTTKAGSWFGFDTWFAESKWGVEWVGSSLVWSSEYVAELAFLLACEAYEKYGVSGAW